MVKLKARQQVIDYNVMPLSLDSSESLSRDINNNLNVIQENLEKQKTDVSNQIEAMVKAMQMPVGTIHLSLSDENPATYLKYGVWEKIADGQCLIGSGKLAAGTSQGRDTITLTEAQMPAHTHTASTSIATGGGTKTTTTSGGTKTTSASGNHKHRGGIGLSSQYWSSPFGNVLYTNQPHAYGTVRSDGVEYEVPLPYTDTTGNHTHTVNIDHNHSININHNHTATTSIGSKGSNAAIDIRQRSLAVNIWHRVE